MQAGFPQGFIEVGEKIKLLQKNLPVDWLVRAHNVRSVDQLVHLYGLQKTWGDENIPVIVSLLQEHERSGYGLIADNNPKNPTSSRGRKSAEGDAPEVAEFVTQFFELLRLETVIWDRINETNFGNHRLMRQAWCNISLKLGGWGAMQHVQMIKSMYRRKRDQYNHDVLKMNKPFQYEEQLNFLKPVIELMNSTDPAVPVSIESFVSMTCPDIDYEAEIDNAPTNTQEILRNCERMIDKIRRSYGEEAASEYMTLCCNDVVANKEAIATMGLTDADWPKVYADTNRNPDEFESWTPIDEFAEEAVKMKNDLDTENQL